MERSVFLRLLDPEVVAGKMTALEREMLRLTLLANPDATLFEALTDVYDYLGIKVKKARLEAIGTRLQIEHERTMSGREQKAAQPDSSQAKDKGKQSDFGAKFIAWVEGLNTDQRLLAACGYDVEKARSIYCEQDYLVADEVIDLWFMHSWQTAMISLEAAAAPWSGSGSQRSSGDVTVYDMTKEADDSPLWGELQACFGGG